MIRQQLFELTRMSRADHALLAEHLMVLDRLLGELVRVEEQIVFARFEQVTGLAEVGPTASLRREHRRIEARLQALPGIATRDCELGDALAAFEVLVSDHLAREETIFGAVSDGLLDEAARREVVEILSRRDPTRVAEGIVNETRPLAVSDRDRRGVET